MKTQPSGKETEYFAKASEYAQKVMNEGHDLADNYWDVFIDLCSDRYNSTGSMRVFGK